MLFYRYFIDQGQKKGTKIYHNNQQIYRLIFILFLSLYYPNLLLAGVRSDNSIAVVVCNVVTQLTGPIGQSVSTVAVIFIGIGLFLGKISWGLALGIAVGMGMLFGAENIVVWISGSDQFTCKI
ncbi:MAG: TrbC/VirB2 family protein [Rickettsiaceae bacterium H1]|nr:TrbC/VirB2 family protein [Rickettsiaceae bacterium H1]